MYFQEIANDIVASSAIEGIILDSSEVRSSVARKLGIKVADEKAPTHYIDGIVEMMLDATANYLDPLSKKRLFSWDGALFPTGRSGLSEINVGAYRTEPMQVVSDMFGREKVHYRAPEAEKVPAEMNTFIDWFNDNDVKPSYIKSAVAHFWFVSIHPFDDGNG
jgi:Fic family protein